MNFFLFDPRPGKENPAVDVGVEVTISALAGLCGINIDPQHGPGGRPTPAACVVVYDALEAERPDLLLAKSAGTVRLDADSLTAFALLENGIFGIDTTLIVSISNLDGIGPQANAPLEHREVFGALSRLALADKRPLEQKISLAAEILRGGGKNFVAEASRLRAEEKAKLLATAKVTRHEGFVVVEATLPGVFDYEAFSSDVIVAVNSSFSFQGGEPHRKVSIARRDEHVALDLRGVLAELQQLEPGWGGGLNIIGSPQGMASAIPTEKIVEVVKRHLKKVR